MDSPTRREDMEVIEIEIVRVRIRTVRWRGPWDVYRRQAVAVHPSTSNPDSFPAERQLCDSAVPAENSRQESRVGFCWRKSGQRSPAASRFASLKRFITR